MSNAAAVIGLTYAGTDIQRSDFGIFLEIVSGINDGLEVRGQDTIVPGLAGRIVRNRKKDRRVVQLKGWISGTGTTASGQLSTFRDFAQAVAALFDQSASPANLVASLEDGTTATLSCRTIEIHFGAQPVPVLQVVEIDLESVTPDWT